MGMRISARTNKEGEIQETQTIIPIEGAGGELGRQMVINLTNLISGLKNQKTEVDVVRHYYIICGFATCCQMSGFLTEESTNDVMHIVEHLVEMEIERAQKEEEGEQA